METIINVNPKKCPKCTDDIDVRERIDVYARYEKDDDLRFDLYGDLLVVAHEPTDSEVIIEMKYCPFCGRKLERSDAVHAALGVD